MDPIGKHGSLPLNASISVIGTTLPFKIILPFQRAVTNTETGYSNIVIHNTVTNNKTAVYLGNTTLNAPLLQNNTGYLLGVDQSGRSVSVLGDVNGDGCNDLIIGVPGRSRCYVMYGTYDGYSNISIGFTINGKSVSDSVGWSVSSAGDVNRDGFADFIVGAPGANVKGVNSAGAAYVIFGHTHGFKNIRLPNITADEGFAVYGEGMSDCVGLSVAAAGDVNGDGYDDIAVGALKTTSFYAGAAYIIYGRLSGFEDIYLENLTPSQGFAIFGVAWQYLGYSLSGVGDVNNDGYDDVLIGTSPPIASLPKAAYLIFGKPGVITTEDLHSDTLTPDVGIMVRKTGGSLVSNVGDVNRDGFDDMLVSGSFPASGGGIVVVSQVKLNKIRSRKPTQAPTALPTTTAPTMRPTTLSPTSPTLVPTLGPTSPTSQPSSQPSQPTIAPSRVPSLHPSEAPTNLAPSVRPSFSMKPTRYPSREPTHYPTKLPTLPPTMLPSMAPSVPHNATSNMTFTPVQLTDPGVYWRTGANLNFIINVTGAYVRVEGEGGADMFTVYPQTNGRLTVMHFNQFSDIIDLRAFKSILEFSQLNITRGSAIIHLPQNQTVRLSNIYPEDLKDNNFVFYEPISSKEVKPKNSEMTKVVRKVVIGLGISLFVTMVVYFVYDTVTKERKRRKIAKLVVKAESKKLVIVQKILIHGVNGAPHVLSAAFDLLPVESSNSSSDSSSNNTKSNDEGSHSQSNSSDLSSIDTFASVSFSGLSSYEPIQKTAPAAYDGTQQPRGRFSSIDSSMIPSPDFSDDDAQGSPRIGSIDFGRGGKSRSVSFDMAAGHLQHSHSFKHHFMRPRRESSESVFSFDESGDLKRSLGLRLRHSNDSVENQANQAALQLKYRRDSYDSNLFSVDAGESEEDSRRASRSRRSSILKQSNRRRSRLLVADNRFRGNSYDSAFGFDESDDVELEKMPEGHLVLGSFHQRTKKVSSVDSEDNAVSMQIKFRGFSFDGSGADEALSAGAMRDVPLASTKEEEQITTEVKYRGQSFDSDATSDFNGYRFYDSDMDSVSV